MVDTQTATDRSTRLTSLHASIHTTPCTLNPPVHLMLCLITETQHLPGSAGHLSFAGHAVVVGSSVGAFRSRATRAVSLYMLIGTRMTEIPTCRNSCNGLSGSCGFFDHQVCTLCLRPLSQLHDDTAVCIVFACTRDSALQLSADQTAAISTVTAKVSFLCSGLNIDY